MSKRGELVCVTGASGAIGSWVVRLLLDRGYSINATVKDLKDENETKHLQALEGAESRLRLFQIDLLDYDSIAAAVSGCAGVFHLASPCSVDKVHEPEKEMLDPAIKGTINVLTAAKESGVGRVVVTSSISSMFPSPRWPADKVRDEDSWTDIDYCKQKELWYPISKTLAEKAAWEFAKEKGLDVVVVNPGTVMGPNIPPRLNASMVMFLKLLQERTVKRPQVNDVQLKRILHAVQLPAKDRSFAVLVTKENLIACGLLLPPSRPPRQIAPATPRPSSVTTMKLPPTKKRLGDAPSTSAAVQPAKKKTVRQEDDVVVVAPPTSVPVQSPVRAPAQASQRTFQEALCFPGSQVYNTSFLVPDVPDARIPQMLALPPRFSLPFEAIYSSFHQDDFEAARRQPLIERAREMVQLNLKALELSLLQYVELEKAGPSSQTERLKKKMNSYKLAREKLDKELSSEREKNRDLERQVEQLKASLVEADKAHQEEVTKVRAGAEESIQKARAEEAARLAEREEALKKQAVEEFRDSSEYEALMREVQHDLLRAMIKEVQERHPNLDTAFLEPEDEAEVEVDAGQPGDQS